MAVYQKLPLSLHVGGHLGCCKFGTIMNNEVYEYLYAGVYTVSISLGQTAQSGVGGSYSWCTHTFIKGTDSSSALCPTPTGVGGPAALLLGLSNHSYSVEGVLVCHSHPSCGSLSLN